MKYTPEQISEHFNIDDINYSLAYVLNNLDLACEGDTLSIRAILRELNYIQRNLDETLTEKMLEKEAQEEAERIAIQMDEEDKLDYKFKTGRYCLLT